ncbi:hypothetical protein BU16DRAFT_598363 [Lophium mytilinum]|uniref:Uncharacterized protein n=1 Tax=Lophium mytilinum TaxID=390894 RepID=A0A6A6QAS5_9PEZI|nr:hypothetical protein BU16DRAFT_598363 [Lophium mytilinum]
MASSGGPRPRLSSPAAFVQEMIDEIDELIETTGRTDTQRLVRDLPLELDAFRAKFEKVKKTIPSDWDAFLEDVGNTDEGSIIQDGVKDLRDTIDGYMRLLSSVINTQTTSATPSSYQIRQDRLAAESMFRQNDSRLAGANSWATGDSNNVQTAAVSVAAGDLPVDYTTCNKVLRTAEYAKMHLEMIRTLSNWARFDEDKYTNLEHTVDEDDYGEIFKLVLKDAMNQRFICLDSALKILNETIRNDSVSLKTEWIDDIKAPLFVKYCLNIEWSMGPRRNRIAHAFGVPNMFIAEKYQPFDPRDHWKYLEAIHDGLISALDEVIRIIEPKYEEALWQQRNENGDGVPGEDTDPWS